MFFSPYAPQYVVRQLLFRSPTSALYLAVDRLFSFASFPFFRRAQKLAQKFTNGEGGGGGGGVRVRTVKGKNSYRTRKKLASYRFRKLHLLGNCEKIPGLQFRKTWQGNQIRAILKKKNRYEIPFVGNKQTAKKAIIIKANK